MATPDERAVAAVRLRDLHPTLKLRLVLAFFERALSTMAIPLMTIYLSQQLGAQTAGVLILVSIAFAVVAGLSSGRVADVSGRRHALLVGAALMTIGFAGMAVAAAWWASPLAVFAFYVLQMSAASFIQPVHEAVIIDVTEPEQRKAAFTLNYWSFNIALAAGALVGGFLYEGYFDELLAGSAVCAMAALVVTYLFLSETAPPAQDARDEGGRLRTILAGYATPLADRRFVLLLLAMTLVLGLEMQRTSGYVAVRLAEDVPTQDLLPFKTGLTVTGIQLLGILQAVNTVGVAVLALVSQRLLGRLDHRRSVVIGLGLFTAGCVVLATGNLAAVLIVAMLAITLGELMHIPAMQTVLAAVVPDHARSTYMAVFNTNIRGGMVIASLSLTAGAVLGPVGMAGVYVALGAGAALLYRGVWATRPTASAPAAPLAARPQTQKGSVT